MNIGRTPVGFLCAAAVGSTVWFALPAHAGHYTGGTGASGCIGVNAPQNATQRYYYDSLQLATSNAVTWNRTNNIDPTNMTTITQTAYGPGTDVWVGDQYYTDYCGDDWYTGPSDPNGAGVVGKGSCYRLVSGGSRCDQHDLRINNWFTDIATTFEERALACHEGGHTLGLAHRTVMTSCLYEGSFPTNQYDGHDIQSINMN